MLAKAASSIHVQVHTEQAQYPYRLFRLVLDPSFADTVISDPACMQDPFTKWYRSKFRTAAELKSADSLQTLLALCILLRLDTMRIECRHASIRRIKNLASQTNAQSLEQASASFGFRAAEGCPKV